MVIGGSDDGFIHVFDKATSERVQTLRHSSVGRVQTVTVRQAILPLATTDAHMKTHDAGDVHLIVAATLSNENNITISMWKKVSTRRQGTKEGPTALYILWAILQAVTHLVAVVVIGIFVLQMTVCDRDCHVVVTLLTGEGLKNGNRTISLTWRSTKYMKGV